MRLFKATYKDRKGVVRESSRWYCEFRDHLEIVRRVPLYTDEKASAEAGRKIERLVALRMAGCEPDAELTRWVEGLEGRLIGKLAEIGLLSASRVSAARPLPELIESWQGALKAKGVTVKHEQTFLRHVRRVLVELCGWRYYGDITADGVRKALEGLRPKISAETSNHHLVSLKAFCRWMVRERLAASSPVSCLSMLNRKTLKQDQRHPRRVVTPLEIAHLLAVTAAEPDRFGMTGPERSLLYRLAVESGLRANELRCLRRGNLKLDAKVPTVTIWNGTDKNAKGVDVPLLPATVERLREHTRDMLPTAPVFAMPDSQHSVFMFKADLKKADIKYVDEAGLFFDFHSLRACTASFLGDAGVPLPTIRDIMRHANIETTMKYVKVSVIRARATALESMPSFDAGEQERAVKEGTTNTTLAVGYETENAKQDAKTGSASIVKTCAQTTSEETGRTLLSAPLSSDCCCVSYAAFFSGIGMTADCRPALAQMK